MAARQGCAASASGAAGSARLITSSGRLEARLRHRGRAVVFADIDDYKARNKNDALDIDETCLMVLSYCSPEAHPGMAAHARASRGHEGLHQQHVDGAETGADLEFLKSRRGAAVGKDSH